MSATAISIVVAGFCSVTKAVQKRQEVLKIKRNQDNSDNTIVQVGYNTRVCTRDLRRLAGVQPTLKDYKVKHQEVPLV